MNLKISFLHMDHTAALDERIREKSEHLQKYLDGHFQVTWTCSIHHDDHFAEVKIVGSRFEALARGRSTNMYKSLDLAMAKVERQLEKQKSRWKEQHSCHHHSKELLRGVA